MKLQGVRDAEVFATRGRDVLVARGSETFDRLGRLPFPGRDRGSVRSGVLASPLLRRLTDRIVGAVPTVNVWPLSGPEVLATVGRQLYVSSDGGRSWDAGDRLPLSSGPMGVLPSAVSHHDGTTYLGEYPLATDVTPRVRVSHDGGRTWWTEASLPDVRHVHAVQRDPYSGDVWVTTGDTDAESRIGRLRDGTLDVVGGGSQRWRAVELAFTPAAVLWGMDCVYADENWIFRLPREEIEARDPSPDPVHRVPGSVYYAAAFDRAGARWVAFSTAMEAGADSTGPADQAGAVRRGVVVAASSETAYEDWYEVASFTRRGCLADRLPGWIPTANAYVFLDAAPERGLLVNPYNTANDGETIRQIPPERFDRTTRSMG